MYFLLLLTLAYLQQSVPAARLMKDVLPKQSLNEMDDPPPYDPPPYASIEDFSWMTTDFSYPEHDPDTKGAIKQWFGGRATSDTVKEDIVEGHTCANRGSLELTYYAASFCYWLPEIPSIGEGKSGLAWRGGSYPDGVPLTQGYSSGKCLFRGHFGKCMKAYVCHNNARAENGAVHRASFVEELELPSYCLKEKEIETKCIEEYNLLNVELEKEDARCHEVEGRYNSAVRALNTCNERLKKYPSEISDIWPKKIKKAQNDLPKLKRKIDDAKNADKKARNQMEWKCRKYENIKGNLPFMGMLRSGTSTKNILFDMSMRYFKCIYPSGADREKMEEFRECKKCDEGKKGIERAKKNWEGAKKDLDLGEKLIPRLKKELLTKEQKLADSHSEHPGLESAKEAMDAEWLPQSSECKQAYDDYSNGKKNAVTKCAATFYDDSCEKACIELQASDTGCGVVEGGSPDDVTGLGGVEVTCEPPQPSWILGPFNYGAHEASGEQCNRIQSHQSVYRAQTISKSGWLWRKKRVGGWEEHFFALESGTKVRSAVLHYWDQDPSEAVFQTNRAPSSIVRPSEVTNEEAVANIASHVGIILRDAKSVKEKDGTDYGFKNGEECFKLYHFYHDYRLCVTSKSPKPGTERNEWVKLIDDAIVG